MYAPFFGLTREPFSIAPDPRFLFMSEQHREALAHLLYGLGGGGGFVLLTGEVGAGKTTVCRCFLEQVPASCAVAYVFNPKLTAPELLQTVCHEFGLPAIAGGSVKDHVDALNAFLLQAHAEGRQAVLVIDEAQALSADVLEQLRLLTNLETAERKLLQIVLIGQPELRDMLARPGLEQLAQRVVARYHLGPLNPAETQAYIRHRLAVAGPRAALPFDAKALARIHALAGGVPRKINLLADRALLGAYGQGQAKADRRTVEQAAREVFFRPAAAGPRARPWLLATAGCTGAAALAAAGWAWNSQHRAAPPALSTAASVPAPAVAASAAVAGGASGAVSAVGASGDAVRSADPTGAIGATGGGGGFGTNVTTGMTGMTGAIGATSATGVTAATNATGPIGVAADRATATGAGNAPGASYGAAADRPVAAAGAALRPPSAAPSADARPLLAAAHVDAATAWRELALRWNVAIGEGEPCAAARLARLACFRSPPPGGLPAVRQLARPGVVALLAEDGSSRHAVLTSLGTSQATLQAAGQTFVLTLPALARVWRGDFATLWRTPPQWREGSDARAWVASHLPDDGGPAAEQPLRDRVLAFQLAEGLRPDGLAGPLTLMRLNRAAGIDEPRLAEVD